MGELVLVRHGPANLDPTRPPHDWPLADVDSCRDLGHILPELPVVSSTERKAVETAAALGRAHSVDTRLCEVSRPFIDDRIRFVTAVRRYLAGEHLAGWEPQESALARFSAAANGIVVSHGTVMSLFVASMSDVDGFEFWSALRTPDAWRLEGSLPVRLGQGGYGAQGTP